MGGLVCSLGVEGGGLWSVVASGQRSGAAMPLGVVAWSVVASGQRAGVAMPLGVVAWSVVASGHCLSATALRGAVF